MFDAVNRVWCPATVGTTSDVIVSDFGTIHDVTLLSDITRSDTVCATVSDHVIVFETTGSAVTVSKIVTVPKVVTVPKIVIMSHYVTVSNVTI